MMANPLWLPLSATFRLGVALRQAGYERGWLRTHRLARPVVSVGNITLGGTGKTPLVACVANLLQRRGWKPSILTRGYGRASKEPMNVLAPGADRQAKASAIGDEPALLARLLPQVPIVICADRFRGGQMAEERFSVDAHILDDGFQHLALARDVDVVALDATQILSDRHLLPAGRQREPLSALRRAQMVVITRTDSADPTPLGELVLKIHPTAKVFRSRTELMGWTDVTSGAAVPTEQIRLQKVTAFCAIGNPRAFFADLRRWGFSLVAEDAFPDHHVYTGEEIERLVEDARKRGASVLLTTRKDATKFSREWAPRLPILACEIETQILAAEDFEATLVSYLEKAS
jgi:tetraacyldisaccharide 4'-kinase